MAITIGIYRHQYYLHGDVAKYCQESSITSELRSKWFQQILEAVVFFIDDNSDLRLGDFNSSQCPGHISPHCLPQDYELPNTETSDIFALESTLYEQVAGKAPYSELSRPKSDDLDIIKSSNLKTTYGRS
ncbi:unnamed protein product [Penicillium roqueforti FM164]|uniref:Uncharacterized protein n=1 Tax=Penicillium roqueforti (strain FM164) TaxID=1365484 RepID=W6QJ48_PENRF|nr:unnamed protein product [Penicillium roqueforti FM164]